MPSRRRNKAEVIRDRRRIADLYLQGVTQADIAEQLTISQSTVSRDIATLHDEWRESALVDINTAKAQELAKIDRLEREYWEAWLESCEDKESSVAEKTMLAKGERSKTQLRKEGQSGNPAFLKGVEWCISERCKIVGVYAATKQELSGYSGGPIELMIVYDDETVEG